MRVNQSLFFGRDRACSRRYLGVAVGLFLGALGVLGLVWIVSQRGVSVPISGAWLLWTVALITVGAPAVQAYQNDGLLISIALGVAIPLAFYLVLTTFDLVYPSEDVLWGVGTALQFGIPAGILGFLIGVGSRRLHKSESAECSRSNT